jgi:hypothetical protein
MRGRRPEPLSSRLARDDSGAAAVTSILMLLSLLGFLGLAIDVGANYMLRRQAQAAADSAAFSAAVAESAGVADLAGQARSVTDQYGLSSGSDGVSVTVNTPPASGVHAGQAGAVEVIIRRPAAFYFASLLQPAAGTIMARSVATAAANSGCLYVLSPTAGNALLMNGGATIQTLGCSVYVNSSSPTALLMNGGATLAAQSILVAGGDLLNAGPIITGTLQTHAAPTPDPHAALTLASLGVPSGGACDAAPAGGPQTFTAVTPHVFCSAPIINGGTASFGPGIYVFQGAFIVNSSVTVTGEGVTFVFRGNGSITINGGATVTLSAPTSGAASGLLMVKDPSAPAGSMNIFNGGDKLRFTGALYFPHQSMILNSAVDLGGCVSLLVDTLIVNGGASLVSACGAGSGGAAKVVE